MKHTYCSTGQHGDVRLMDHSGFWHCDKGESWGVETEGIWVDRGCKGRFWVDDKKSGHDNHGRNTAVAAALGVGLLALLATSHAKSDDSSHGTLPNWLVGNYHGYNPRERAESTLSVGAGGIITGRAQGHDVRGKFEGGDVIAWEDGPKFKVSRSDRGIRLIQVDDASNIVDYYRD